MGTVIASHPTDKVDSIAMAPSCKLLCDWVRKGKPTIGREAVVSLKHCYTSRIHDVPVHGRQGHIPRQSRLGVLRRTFGLLLWRLVRGKSWLLKELVPGQCLCNTCSRQARRAVHGEIFQHQRAGEDSHVLGRVCTQALTFPMVRYLRWGNASSTHGTREARVLDVLSLWEVV